MAQSPSSKALVSHRAGTWLFAAILLVIALFIGYRNFRSPKFSGSQVLASFENPGGILTPVFKLELALDEKQRSFGLMYRKEMNQDAGMLFVFPDERPRSFWMKNTFISLDMLFLDKNLKVVGILHDVPVLNEDARAVGAPSKYVVELVAGTARRYGIVESSVLLPQSEIPSGR